MTGRRIAHLTSVHPTDDVRIFHKEGRSLAAAGYDVAVIGPAAADAERDGVRIRALPVPSSRRTRMTRTVWQVFRAALAEEAEVYHFHDPELIPVGLALKALGKRVVYDVHEDMPATLLTKAYLPATAREHVARAAELVEKLSARTFDAVVAATPAIAGRFPASRCVTVQNFPLPSEARPAPGRHAWRPPLVVYMGSITARRGAREMVDAMGRLPEALGAELALAGTFSPASLLPALRARPGWARVDYRGQVSRGEVAGLLGAARAGLVLFHPGPNHGESQPNKLFEYMAAGLPVIASNFPLWRRLIGDTGCGLLVDPHEPDAIAEAIAWLLTHPEEGEAMGARGAEAVRSRFHWGVEEQALLGLYRTLVSPMEVAS